MTFNEKMLQGAVPKVLQRLGRSGSGALVKHHLSNLGHGFTSTKRKFSIFVSPRLYKARD